jgi:hypothetical protein
VGLWRTAFTAVTVLEVTVAVEYPWYPARLRTTVRSPAVTAFRLKEPEKYHQ